MIRQRKNAIQSNAIANVKLHYRQEHRKEIRVLMDLKVIEATKVIKGKKESKVPLVTPALREPEVILVRRVTRDSLV